MGMYLVRPRRAGWRLLVIASLPLLALLAPAQAYSRAPSISGSPATSIKVDSYYYFKPTASDPDTPLKALRFSITNKPAWASFSVYSGKLQGTPTRAGTWSDIRIRVSDGSASAALPAFSISASTAGGGGNQAPRISGTPPTSVRSGTAYAFTPTASDPNGDALTFSIRNKPSWASFSTSSGRLSGTPSGAQVGTYSNVTITVSDGKASATLPAFNITVSDTGNGSASLSWTPPTQNTDGSSLTNLAGYRIYYGTSSGSMTQRIQVANPGIAGYVVGNLTPGTWYFNVRAYSSRGAESAASNVATKTVR